MDSLGVLAVALAAGCGLVGGALGPTVLAGLPAPPEPSSDRPAYAVRLTYAELAATDYLGPALGFVSMVIAVLVGWRIGWHPTLLPWMVLVPVGVTLAAVDWRMRLLPTRIIAPAYAATSALILLAGLLEHSWSPVLHAAEGWAVVGGFYLLLWLIYPKGIGYGDVRLAGLLGLALGVLGWPQVLVGGYAGLLLGALLGPLLVAFQVVDRKAMPFGPFMVAGAVCGVLFGPVLAGALG